MLSRALARGLVLGLLLLLPLQSEAARLFTSGFETNDLAATEWSSAAAGASIVTTTPHSGTYSGQVTGTTGKNFSRALPTGLVEGATIYYRFYWRTNNVSAANSRFHSTRSSAGTVGLDLSKRTTGVIRLTNTPTAETVESTFTVSVDTWYRFEIRHLISDTVGEIEVRIYVGDSTTITETITFGAANKDTLPNANVRDFFFEESAANGSITYLFDDVAINDTSGSLQTSWPGPGKVYLLVPNADVSITWENEAAGAATFAKIDDLPGTPDDLTTYNTEVVTLNSVDRFGLTNLGAEVPSDATITLVDVAGRVGSTQTSSTLMRFKLWDEGGALTDGPNLNANVNGWKFPTTAEHLVVTGSGKTKANLDSFNIGYENLTDVATRERRVTAAWANVEWLEAVAGGATPHNLMLMGVGQ